MLNLFYGGVHIGFPIHTNIKNIVRDYSCTVWVQSNFSVPEIVFFYIFQYGPILKLCPVLRS
jgi:hypothetical protein